MLDIVHLRHFKAYVEEYVPEDVYGEPLSDYEDVTWRFYLEYAPYGNLENLHGQCVAFHRYLPESFLWHVFNSLAKAIQVLDTQQRGDNPTREAEYVVHSDIKLPNIVLGYEGLDWPRSQVDNHAGGTKESSSFYTGGLQNDLYPSTKLGDFRPAHYTNQLDRHNPRRFNKIGTDYFPRPVRVRDARRNTS